MFEDLVDKFRDELNPGEKIIWTGQPQQGFMLRPADALMIPFSLMWGGFAIFWEFTAVLGGAPFFFMLWGIPFVLVGLYMIFGRFFVDTAQRGKTYYALTNERVLIISGLFTQNLKMLKLQMLPEINITTSDNGKGTIIFGAADSMGWMYAGGGFPNTGRYNIPPSFEMIDDVKTVYQKIKLLQREKDE